MHRWWTGRISLRVRVKDTVGLRIRVRYWIRVWIRVWLRIMVGFALGSGFGFGLELGWEIDESKWKDPWMQGQSTEIDGKSHGRTGC